MNYSYIDENLAEIRERIEAAALRSGREASDITLLSAIKSADVGEINYIHGSLGINDVGENRVQQLLERYELIDRSGLNIHFIGSLQSNKVKYIIDKVSLIHSLDSLSLAREIQKQAKKAGVCAPVLVEINSGGESAKGGVLPDEAESFCISLAQFDSIKLCGFMTMAPHCDTPDGYLPYFEKTRILSDRLWKEALGREGRPLLSMGMSESFESAIECGADIVRVGRGMFARRTKD